MGNSQTIYEKYNLDPNDSRYKDESYPSKIGEKYTLKNKRTVGYRIHGEIKNYQTTILFFTGAPSYRGSIYKSHEEIYKKYRIRFINVDYPGIGFSTFYEYEINLLSKNFMDGIFGW